jgi:TonB family protein
MKRGLALGFFLLMVLSRPTSTQQTYKPPEVASAADVYVPYQVVVDGLFVLDVSLDDNGTIQKMDALRDPGAMIGTASKSVSGWKFHPASQEGKAAPSRMTITFLYRPPNYGNVGVIPPKGFSPVLPPDQSDSAHGNYVPVGILSFAYPDYPVNSVISGSVVVQVTVDGAGDVKGVEFLHGMENFNKFVSAALKRWRFQAATFNGKPITSKTVIAFTFQPPPSGNR